MNFKTYCEFSDPQKIGGLQGATTTAFSKMNCTTSNPVVLEITNGTNTAYISQSWDFGMLFIAFLLVFGIFVWTATTIFTFLFHKWTAITTRKKFPMK